jgi:1,4-dihydroxy-2-naphthoate octaprenyltransferase
MTTPPSVHPVALWIQAARPKTLWAAFAPVLMGTAMAVAAHAFDAASAAAALAFALLIQIGTNFCNDYCDFMKGADTEDRQGPVRVTQAGLIPPRTVLAATILTYGAALLVSGFLIYRGGWPMVWIGAACVAAGALYTAGPYPLGYLGLGDVFVLVFFGPVAVAGTYYVQALHLDWEPVFAGLAPGLLSVAILTVNNFRDREQDAKAGKRTLAVRFGIAFARAEYLGCLLGALAVPPILVVATGGHAWTLLTLALIPIAIRMLRTILTRTDAASLNPMLGGTARLLLLYSILFSVGWVIR